jgi:hypothetical protein
MYICALFFFISKRAIFKGLWFIILIIYYNWSYMLVVSNTFSFQLNFVPATEVILLRWLNTFYFRDFLLFLEFLFYFSGYWVKFLFFKSIICLEARKFFLQTRIRYPIILEWVFCAWVLLVTFLKLKEFGQIFFHSEESISLLRF